MDKLNVLVLGDGLLGSEIVKQTGWNFISRKKDEFDIFNIDESLNNIEFDIIINCIANTDTYSNDRKKHWDVNYYFVSKLIEYCNLKSKKLVHISTDYVYANSVDNASEDDVPVHCNNWYGYTKLLSDGLVQLQSNDYLLIRCAHKPNPFPYDKAWIDQIGNFDYVDIISNLIIQLVIKDASGLYNVGTDIKTIHELALKTNNNVEKTFSNLNVPKNQSMNISKMKNKLSDRPFFSIAIPTYEMHGFGDVFLEKSFELLKSQTFQDFEVVISDHSSDDSVENLCIRWKDILNIKYHRNTYKIGGSSPNINTAMKLSNGFWIKLLWQDDFLFGDDALENLKKHIDDNKNIVWVATACEHSNDGDIMYRKFYPSWNEKIHFGINTISSPSVITIKNDERKIYFDEDLIWLMDVDYYKRMYMEYGEPSYLNKINVVNRTWESQLSNTISKEIKDYELNKMVQKYK
jgi:dTDP-4-dehydrorhamnose reductase